jgi:hypothetical protein
LSSSPREAGIQGVNGIARYARDLKSYVRVAPPLHPGSLFFACPKKSDQKKGRPGAADCFLRFSGKSVLA